PCLFNDAADTYLDWSKASKKSWKTDGYRLERLKETFGTMRLDEITADAVEKFKVELVGHCSKATTNRHLALLRHILNKKGFKANNPGSNARLFREENTRIRWLNSEEEVALFAVIPEPYQTLCRVALYTGCRRSELLSPQWDQIDWTRNVLVLP